MGVRGRGFATARAATLGVAVLTGSAWAAAQEAAPAALPPAVDDEVVVIGKQLAELRVRIELAEDEVYGRFNEINSNDLFDIHCYEWAPVGSRILRENRRCVSNAWRKFDQQYASSLVQGLQSAAVVGQGDASTVVAGYNYVPEQYRANQLGTEGVVRAELRELAHSDPALEAAMLRLGRAYQALQVIAGTRSEWTFYRELTVGEPALPFDARRGFEVRVGAVAWSLELMARTFTIASVNGHIRGLDVECAARSTRLPYEAAREWTIPDVWGPCTLSVRAKRGTSFALYEFD